jgi:hypothetical protein
VAYLDSAQRFVRDMNGDGKLDRVEIAQPPAEPIVFDLSRPVTLAELVAQGEPHFNRLCLLAKVSPSGARILQAQLHENLVAEGETLANCLLPSYVRAIELYCRVAVERARVRIVLGAHVFKSKNGRWPHDLKEATEDESPDIRQDPFSGKELVYKVAGDSFLLYSVGEDCKDDGGKRAASGKQWTRDEPCDAILWPLSD